MASVSISGPLILILGFYPRSAVLFCFILFSVVTVSIIRIFNELLVVYVVCVLVCPFVQTTFVCFHASGMWGEGLGDYVLFIGCLLPLVAGVPLSLGVLPLTSSVSAVPIFSEHHLL